MKQTSIKIFRCLLITLALCSILTGMPAKAQNLGSERILNFYSDIFVNTDASLDVTETLQVVALQERIRHGIYRSLRDSFRDHNGKYHPLTYELREVLLDSNPAPYHTAYEGLSFVVYVGSPDELLPPGTYVYTLKYHVSNAVTFLPGEDELYWNITGNEWQVPIDAVQVNIYLPAKARPTHYAAYAGVLGERGQDFQTAASSENELSFVTTRVLQPGQGLTVMLAWPKGFVTQPTFRDQLQDFYVRNKGVLASALTLVLLLIYYSLIWLREGQEPPEGTIIPLFEPPADLSPAALRYISQMDFDNKTFATAVVSLAAAGYLTINDNEGSFTLVRQQPAAPPKISEAERALLDQLFADDNTLNLGKRENIAVISAKSVLKNNLKTEFENVYFLTHSRDLIPGFFLGFLAAFFLPWNLDQNSLPTVAVLIFGYVYFLYSLFLKSQNAIKEMREQAGLIKMISALFFLLLTFTMLGLGLLLVWVGGVQGVNLGLLAAAIFINLAFYHLLKVHTPQGRKLMDQVEGFKMFLAATERDRLDKLNPPDKTPQLFEKYLPYAMALDIENAWGAQFASILQTSGAAGQSYQPVWYIGNRWSSSSPGSFSSSLLSGLSSALASSVASAGGGGGFSGGGGGGGGGGGW